MLNELAQEIYENSAAHGWHSEKRSFGDIAALAHSEISEALEEFRNGMPMEYHICKLVRNEDNPKDRIAGKCDDCSPLCENYMKKNEGIAVELIDCVIRIFDYLASEGIDIDRVMREKMDYNKTRSWRHNNKVI